MERSGKAMDPRIRAAVLAASLAAALLLAGCAPRGTELPDNGADGTLKRSPCACMEIEDYDGGGFEWPAG